MFKLRLACIGVVLLPLAVAGRTQTVEITVDTKVGAGQIQDWLASGDPRLVAWGAYFARENADDAAVTRMLQLVARWENSDQYLKELGARVALEEAQMHETVEALRAEKLLTKSEYDTVRAKLTVVVSDDRTSAHGPLPMLDSRDPHTMITFANQ
jgi:hypothetical protein